MNSSAGLLSSQPIRLTLIAWALAALLPGLSRAQTPPVVPTTVYVNQDLVSGNDDGTSWQNAFFQTTAAGTPLERAIAAQLAYGEIWVAQSLITYDPSNLATGFRITKPLKLYGGFFGDEASVKARHGSYRSTILMGATGAGHAKHVVSIGPPTIAFPTVPGVVIDGFQIREGQDIIQFGAAGGGIYCESFDLDLANCFFYQNLVHDFGGGLYFLGGGGIDPQVYDFNHLRIKNSEFSYNATDNEGGAIHATRARGEVVNTSFTWNSAFFQGGAVLLQDMLPEHRLDFTNCVFWKNAVTTPPSDTNPPRGGAVRVRQQGSARLVNCTFADNSLNDTLGGPALHADPTSSAWVYNSIAYFNSGGPPIVGATFDYSNVETWTGGGTGNMSADPLFVNRSAGNLRLTYLPLATPPVVSLCLDRADYSRLPPDNLDVNGDNDFLRVIPIDLDAVRRLKDLPSAPNLGVGSTTCPLCPTYTFLDMGAYERP